MVFTILRRLWPWGVGGRGSGSCKPTIYSSKSVGISTKCTDEKQLYSHSRILPLLSWHDVTNFFARTSRCCHTATSFYYTDHFKLWASAIPNRKPRSEWHGWETSFKQALLLRAEGAIRAFFDGYCRGDVASGVRNVAITRRRQTHFSLPLRLRNYAWISVRVNHSVHGQAVKDVVV